MVRGPAMAAKLAPAVVANDSASAESPAGAMMHSSSRRRAAVTGSPPGGGPAVRQQDRDPASGGAAGQLGSGGVEGRRPGRWCRSRAGAGCHRPPRRPGGRAVGGLDGHHLVAESQRRPLLGRSQGASRGGHCGGGQPGAAHRPRPVHHQGDRSGGTLPALHPQLLQPGLPALGTGPRAGRRGCGRCRRRPRRGRPVRARGVRPRLPTPSRLGPGRARGGPPARRPARPSGWSAAAAMSASRARVWSGSAAACAATSAASRAPVVGLSSLKPGWPS